MLKIITNSLDEINPLNNKLLENWTHIWKYDFELDNYTNEELSTSINKVCNLNIKPQEIKKLRNEENKKGIKSLNAKLEDNKIKINEDLLKNFKNKFETTKDTSLLDRPIFNVINKLRDIDLTNYPPTNTRIANLNKEILSNSILKNKDEIFNE